MRPHLELLARLLVHVRGSQHRPSADRCRQEHGTGHARPGASDGLDDLLDRAVQEAVVVGPQADPDLPDRSVRTTALLHDLRDDARPHRAAPSADREPQLLLHRNRRDQLHRHRHVVPGITISTPPAACTPPSRPSSGSRTAAGTLEERRVPPPSSFASTYTSALNVLVRHDRPRLRQHLPPLHLVLVDPRNSAPTLSPACPSSSSLPEHLHPVTTLFRAASCIPTISISSPPSRSPLDPPRHHRPPPVMLKMSSTGIRNGLSTGRIGVGM